MKTTLEQYDDIMGKCRELFLQKNSDYGSSWRVLRPPSLTDQLYIKAMRIRTIEESGQNLVGDDIREDYIGLINYSIMALVQLDHPYRDETDLHFPLEKLLAVYDGNVQEIRSLLAKKNHDYGEVWRDMRLSSMTDLILMKLLRIKSIEDNDGQTVVSEGLDANYMDIINYSVFALIKISES